MTADYESLKSDVGSLKWGSVKRVKLEVKSEVKWEV